jgi:hypothetical protein
MAKSKAAKHLHRYKKFNLSRDAKPYFVYRCVLPMCSHYIPVGQSLGRACICNRCGEPMVITRLQLQGSHGGPMALPHCVDCIERREESGISQIEKEAILKLIEEKEKANG